MALSRLSILLKSISSFENVEMEEIHTEQQDRETVYKTLGAWSDIKFYKLPNVRFQIQRKEPPQSFFQPAEVVISTYKSPEALHILDTPLTPSLRRHYLNQIETRKALTAQSFLILARKNVPSHFNMSYLAYNYDSKITFRGKEDLFDFMMVDYKRNQQYFTKDNIKRLVGQIILAVYDLHVNDCAHRDIKHENFIVYEVDGKIFLSLSDHSDLVETYSNGQSKEYLSTFCGTKELSAPELTACTPATLQTLNLKAIDCYALGMTIYQLIEKLFLFKDRIDPSSITLAERVAFEQNSDLISILALCNDLLKSSQKRPTIIEAKNYDYFGADASAREHFFAELVAERENYQLMIDEEYKIQTEGYISNDYFLLLDHQLKSLSLTTYNFMESMEDCSTCMHDATADIIVQQAKADKMMAIGTCVTNQVSHLVKSGLFSKAKGPLIEIRDIIEQEIDFTEMSKVVKDTLDTFIKDHKKAHPHKLFSNDVATEIHDFHSLYRNFLTTADSDKKSQQFINQLIAFIDPKSLMNTCSLKHVLNEKLQRSFKLSYDQAVLLLNQNKLKDNSQEEKTTSLVA